MKLITLLESGDLERFQQELEREFNKRLRSKLQVYKVAYFDQLTEDTLMITFKQLQERLLQEGTWAIPFKAQQATLLKRMMASPIPAKDASAKLYKLVGGDEFFDYVDEMIRDGEPQSDVRSLAIEVVVGWILQAMRSPSSFRGVFEKEAVDIYIDLYKRYGWNERSTVMKLQQYEQPK